MMTTASRNGKGFTVQWGSVEKVVVALIIFACLGVIGTVAGAIVVIPMQDIRITRLEQFADSGERFTKSEHIKFEESVDQRNDTQDADRIEIRRQIRELIKLQREDHDILVEIKAVMQKSGHP